MRIFQNQDIESMIQTGVPVSHQSHLSTKTTKSIRQQGFIIFLRVWRNK